jgi:hypothetical protein
MEQSKYYPVEMTIPLPSLTEAEIGKLRSADEVRHVDLTSSSQPLVNLLSPSAVVQVLKNIQNIRAEQFKQIEEIKRTQADIIVSGLTSGAVPLGAIEEVQNRLLASIQQMQVKLVEIVQNVVVDANGLCVVRGIVIF